MLGIFVISNYLSANQLESNFVILDDIFTYEDYLYEEKYDLIPIKQFTNCDFAVLDADGNYIYTTNPEIEANITGEEAGYISDYYSNGYYYILNKRKKDDTIHTLIFLNSYDMDADMEVINGYAELDQNNQVIGGDIFPIGTYISNQDIMLLNGYYSDEAAIEKYEFVTNNNEERTLLFISPLISTAYYTSLLDESKIFWIIALVVIAVVIIFEAYLFNLKLKKPFNKLSVAISSYKDGDHLIIDKKSLPTEFAQIVDEFDLVLKKLNQSEQEKNKIYQERQKMIANVSHDIKTPLTVISGYTKAFLDHMVPDDKKEKYLETIYQKVLYTGDLVDTLFEFTQMDHSDYQVQLEEVNFNLFCKEYLASKYEEICIKNFNLQVFITEEPIIIHIDRKLMKRCFENLINNSLNHNKEGTTIYFHLYVRKNKVVILIGDNGVGISNEMRKVLFMPFTTSNEARESGKGVGLGMAITKKIVELHHGSIRLSKKSKYGYQTEFIITLPKA